MSNMIQAARAQVAQLTQAAYEKAVLAVGNTEGVAGVDTDNLKVAAAAEEAVFYTVKSGDTLWKIAKQFYTTVESIKEINELTDDRLKPGDRLVIMKKLKDL